MRALLPPALLLAACVAVQGDGLTHEDHLVAVGLRWHHPAPHATVSTLAWKVAVEAVNVLGVGVPMPHGTLCFEARMVAKNETVSACFPHDSRVHTSTRTWESLLSINPGEEPHADGDAEFRMTLQADPKYVFVEAHPQHAHHHGYTPGSLLASPTIPVYYALACRDCAAHAPSTPLGDNPSVGAVIADHVCRTSTCGDTTGFMGALSQVRGAYHPAVVGPDATRLASWRPLPVLRSRLGLPRLLEGDGGMRIAVEVGVHRGESLEWLLAHAPSLWVAFGVDPWTKQANYSDVVNLEDFDENYARTLAVTERFAGKAHLLRQSSTEAAASFPDGFVDVVYIDARHDYKSCMEDMEAWWPKLRPGGILAGHDFLDAPDVRLLVGGMDWSVMNNGSHHPQDLAVRGAVEEFAGRHQRQVVATTHDTWPSWMMRR